jgi:hypothetical protein
MTTYNINTKRITIASGANTSTASIRTNDEAPFKFVFPATMTNTSFTIEEQIEGDWYTAHYQGAPLVVSVVNGSESLPPDACYFLQNPIRLKGVSNEAAARAIIIQYRLF